MTINFTDRELQIIKFALYNYQRTADADDAEIMGLPLTDYRDELVHLEVKLIREQQRQ